MMVVEAEVEVVVVVRVEDMRLVLSNECVGWNVLTVPSEQSVSQATSSSTSSRTPTARHCQPPSPAVRGERSAPCLH